MMSFEKFMSMNTRIAKFEMAGRACLLAMCSELAKEIGNNDDEFQKCLQHPATNAPAQTQEAHKT